MRDRQWRDHVVLQLGKSQAALGGRPATESKQSSGMPQTAAMARTPLLAPHIQFSEELGFAGNRLGHNNNYNKATEVPLRPTAAVHMHQPNHLSKQSDLAAYHCAAVVVRLFPANVMRERVDKVDVAALNIRRGNPGARGGRHLQRPVSKRSIQISIL